MSEEAGDIGGRPEGRLVRLVESTLGFAAGAVLFGLMSITVVDVFGRYALDAPLPAGLAGVPPPVLAEVTREYDPCPPGGTACGASDWCDLRQRMHYILHLFRAFAVDASLFRPPFTVEQVARFRAGVVPDGDL